MIEDYAGSFDDRFSRIIGNFMLKLFQQFTRIRIFYTLLLWAAFFALFTAI